MLVFPLRGGDHQTFQGLVHNTSKHMNCNAIMGRRHKIFRRKILGHDPYVEIIKQCEEMLRWSISMRLASAGHPIASQIFKIAAHHSKRYDM